MTSDLEWARPRGPIRIAGAASRGRSPSEPQRASAPHWVVPVPRAEGATAPAPRAPTEDHPGARILFGPVVRCVFCTGGGGSGGQMHMSRGCQTVRGARRRKECTVSALARGGVLPCAILATTTRRAARGCAPSRSTVGGGNDAAGWVPAGEGGPVRQLAGPCRLAALGWTPRPSARRGSGRPSRIPQGVGVDGVSDVAVRHFMAAPTSRGSPAAPAPRRDAQDVGGGGRVPAVEACGTGCVRGVRGSGPSEVEHAGARRRHDRSGGFAVRVPAAAPPSFGCTAEGPGHAVQRLGGPVSREFRAHIHCYGVSGGGRGGAPCPPATDGSGASV